MELFFIFKVIKLYNHSGYFLNTANIIFTKNNQLLQIKINYKFLLLLAVLKFLSLKPILFSI